MTRTAWLLSLWVACAPDRFDPDAFDYDGDDVPIWPEPHATFVHPVLEVPEDFGTPSVFVVGGHGTGGNTGNLGCLCQREEDFTLEASTDLADRLDAMGIFDVRLGRDADERPSYPTRLGRLARSGADVMLELHSDSRGGDWYAVDVSDEGEWCLQTDTSPGLSILVSDEGAEALNADRLALARHVADALAETGFGMYDGQAYVDDYDADTTPGVFVDRRGLMMLRRPTVPSIIIETHNAKDRAEVLRWMEGRTHDAFGRAVAEALIRYFSER